MEGGLARGVGEVEVGLGLDQLLDHSFYGQPGGQDERRRPVLRGGVQVSRPVLQQNVEDSLGVGSHR